GRPETVFRRGDPAADQLTSERHQQRPGCTQIAREFRRVPLERFDRAVVVVGFLGPQDEREMLPVELVAQALARARGSDVFPRKQSADGFGAQGGGITYPALALVRIVPDQIPGERLQVPERPGGACLD